MISDKSSLITQIPDAILFQALEQEFADSKRSFDELQKMLDGPGFKAEEFINELYVSILFRGSGVAFCREAVREIKRRRDSSVHPRDRLVSAASLLCDLGLELVAGGLDGYGSLTIRPEDLVEFACHPVSFWSRVFQCDACTAWAFIRFAKAGIYCTGEKRDRTRCGSHIQSTFGPGFQWGVDDRCSIHRGKVSRFAIDATAVPPSGLISGEGRVENRSSSTKDARFASCSRTDKVLQQGDVVSRWGTWFIASIWPHAVKEIGLKIELNVSVPGSPGWLQVAECELTRDKLRELSRPLENPGEDSFQNELNRLRIENEILRKDARKETLQAVTQFLYSSVPEGAPH